MVWLGKEGNLQKSMGRKKKDEEARISSMEEGRVLRLMGEVDKQGEVR